MDKPIIWQVLDFKVVPLLFQIGFRNGLKSGQRPTNKEYLEAWDRHPDWLAPMGNIEQFADDLKYQGKKIYKKGKLYDPDKNNRTNNS